jgi:hypothetical protein
LVDNNKEIMALKRQVDTLEDEKDTLQIKVSEQELHIIE